MKKTIFIALLLGVLLAACGQAAQEPLPTPKVDVIWRGDWKVFFGPDEIDMVVPFGQRGAEVWFGFLGSKGQLSFWGVALGQTLRGNYTHPVTGEPWHFYFRTNKMENRFCGSAWSESDPNRTWAVCGFRDGAGMPSPCKCKPPK